MIRLLKSVTEKSEKLSEGKPCYVHKDADKNDRVPLPETMQAAQHILKAQPEKSGAVNLQF